MERILKRDLALPILGRSMILCVCRFEGVVIDLSTFLAGYVLKVSSERPKTTNYNIPVGLFRLVIKCQADQDRYSPYRARPGTPSHASEASQAPRSSPL